MTVGRKVCSQNRPNNAFPCVTPLLVNKKHTCLTIIKSASKTTKASISQQQCACADFFSVRRIRRGGWTTATGRDITPCFPLPFLHCNALSAFSPPLCGQIPLVFRELSFQGSVGPPSLFHPNAFFCLRGACAQLAREMQLNFSVLALLDFHILKPLLLDPYKMPNEQCKRYIYINKYMYIYIYVMIVHGNTCANLAPSLCFAGFPCVTPHNENVKSYKSVGCVPPSLQFEYRTRTFDRLSYIYIYIYEKMFCWTMISKDHYNCEILAFKILSLGPRLLNILTSSLQLYSSLLYFAPLYSSLLYLSLLFSALHVSSLLHLSLLFSTPPFSTLLYSTLPCSTLLSSALLYSSLFSSAFILSTPLYASLLYSTLLFSAQLFSTLLHFSPLFSTLLFSSVLFSSLLCSSLLSRSVLYAAPLYSSLLTLLFFTLLFSPPLDSSLLCSTLLFSSLLVSALLYSTRFFSSLLVSALLYSTFLYAFLLHPSPLFSTLLCSALLYSTGSTLLYSTLLYSTLLYLTLLYPAVLYSFLLFQLSTFNACALCARLFSSAAARSSCLFTDIADTKTKNRSAGQ